VDFWSVANLSQQNYIYILYNPVLMHKYFILAHITHTSTLFEGGDRICSEKN